MVWRRHCDAAAALWCGGGLRCGGGTLVQRRHYGRRRHFGAADSFSKSFRNQLSAHFLARGISSLRYYNVVIQYVHQIKTQGIIFSSILSWN